MRIQFYLREENGNHTEIEVFHDMVSIEYLCSILKE